MHRTKAYTSIVAIRYFRVYAYHCVSLRKKMKAYFIKLFLIFILILQGCGESSFLIKGKIINSENKQPLSNMDLNFTCDYSCGFMKECTRNYNTKTDSNGEFEIILDSDCLWGGLEIEKLNFMPKRIGFEKLKPEEEINIELKPCVQSKSIKSLIRTDFIGIQENLPFFKVEYISDSLSKSIDVIEWGYDFDSLKNSKNINECELWIKSLNPKVDYPNFFDHKTNGIGFLYKPKFLVVCSKNTMLIPIFENDIQGSFRYENEFIPKKKFKKEHEISGMELGFYISFKQENSTKYAKLIRTSREDERYLNHFHRRPKMRINRNNYGYVYDLLIQNNGSRQFNQCLK